MDRHLAFMDHYLKRKARAELQSSVYTKLLKGSHSPVPVDPKNKIERPEIVTKNLQICFFPATEQDAKETTRFGVGKLMQSLNCATNSQK